MAETVGLNGFIDPLNTAQYALDCGDATETLMIGFNSFTGPRVVRDVLDYFPGGNTGSWVRSVPAGRVVCEPITIAKAIVPIDQLDNLRAWFNQVVAPGSGKGFQSYNFRRPVKIMAKDNAGVVQRTITLFNAWPVAMKALPDFDGNSPAIVVEELEIRWEGWDLGGVIGAPTLPTPIPLG